MSQTFGMITAERAFTVIILQWRVYIAIFIFEAMQKRRRDNYTQMRK